MAYLIYKRNTQNHPKYPNMRHLVAIFMYDEELAKEFAEEYIEGDFSEYDMVELSYLNITNFPRIGADGIIWTDVEEEK